MELPHLKMRPTTAPSHSTSSSSSLHSSDEREAEARFRTRDIRGYWLRITRLPVGDNPSAL
jgi:hypothetical protein